MASVRMFETQSIVMVLLCLMIQVSGGRRGSWTLGEAGKTDADFASFLSKVASCDFSVLSLDAKFPTPSNSSHPSPAVQMSRLLHVLQELSCGFKLVLSIETSVLDALGSISPDEEDCVLVGISRLNLELRRLEVVRRLSSLHPGHQYSFTCIASMLQLDAPRVSFQDLHLVSDGNSPFSNVEIGLLAEVLKSNTFLSRLVLGTHTPLSSLAAQGLQSSLIQNRVLSSLTFVNVVFSTEALTYISRGIAKNAFVKRLHFRSCYFPRNGDITILAREGIAPNDVLTELELSAGLIVTADPLLEALGNSSRLEVLSLASSGAMITARDDQFPSFHHLQRLDLSGVCVHSESYKVILKALASAPLEILNLNNGVRCPFDDYVLDAEAAIVFAEAMRGNGYRHLKGLDLSSTAIAGTGTVALLAGVLENGSRHLQHLNFNFLGLGDDDAREIGRVLERSRCQNLSLALSYNHIRDPGMNALGLSLDKHTTSCSYEPIIELDLRGNPIRTIPLAWLQPLENGVHLNLADTHLETPPLEITKMYSEALIDYLRMVRRIGTEEVHHIRLFYVGFAGVGKTTLRKTFAVVTDPSATDQAKQDALNLLRSTPHVGTQGIEVTKWAWKNLTFSQWDFAGEMQYYPIHSHFLRDTKAVYLVLSSYVTLENKARKQSEIENDLRYWVSFVRGKMKEDVVRNPDQYPDRARLLVLVTKFDMLPNGRHGLNAEGIRSFLCGAFTPEFVDKFVMIFDPLQYNLANLASVRATMNRFEKKVMAIDETRVPEVPRLFANWHRARQQEPELPVGHPVETCEAVRQGIRALMETLPAPDGVRDLESSPRSDPLAERLIDMCLVYHHTSVGSILLPNTVNLRTCEYVILRPQWLFTDMLPTFVDVGLVNGSKAHHIAIDRGVVKQSDVVAHFREKPARAVLGILTDYDLAVRDEENSEEVLYFFPALVGSLPWQKMSQVISDWSSSGRRHVGQIFHSLHTDVDDLNPELFQKLSLRLSYLRNVQHKAHFYSNAIVIPTSQNGDYVLIYAAHAYKYIVVLTMWSESQVRVRNLVHKKVEDIYRSTQGTYHRQNMRAHALCPHCLQTTFETLSTGIDIDSSSDKFRWKLEESLSHVKYLDLWAPNIHSSIRSSPQPPVFATVREKVPETVVHQTSDPVREHRVEPFYRAHNILECGPPQLEMDHMSAFREIRCQDPLPPVPVVRSKINCMDPVPVKPSVVTENGQCDGNATIRYTWSVTDVFDRPSTLVHTVVRFDNDGPNISSNKTIRIKCHETTEEYDSPNVDDSCDKSPVLMEVKLIEPIKVYHNLSLCHEPRMIQRRLTARDSCGNIGTFAQTVHVLPDKSPPYLVDGPTGDSGIPTCDDIADPTYKDLCTAVTVSSKTVSDSGLGFGLRNVTWNVSDSCGNRVVHETVCQAYANLNCSLKGECTCKSGFFIGGYFGYYCVELQILVTMPLVGLAIAILFCYGPPNVSRFRKRGEQAEQDDPLKGFIQALDSPRPLVNPCLVPNLRIVQRHVTRFLRDWTRTLDGKSRFTPKVRWQEGGSIANKTYLPWSDIDILFVLNASSPLSCGKSNDLHWEDGEPVTEDQIKAIAQVLSEAMEQATSQEEFRATMKPIMKGKPTTVYSFECGSLNDSRGMSRHDIDLMFSFASASAFHLIGMDGQTTRSSTSYAADTIERSEQIYPGFRNIVKILKVFKEECPVHLKSCAFESVVSLVANKLQVDAWKGKRYSILLQNCLSALEALCDGDGQIVYLTSVNENPLKDLTPEEATTVREWARKCRELDESQVHARLQRLVAEQKICALARSLSGDGTQTAELQSHLQDFLGSLDKVLAPALSTLGSFVYKMYYEVAGSVANGTDLWNSDLDAIVILNNGANNAIEFRDGAPWCRGHALQGDDIAAVRQKFSGAVGSTLAENQHLELVSDSSQGGRLYYEVSLSNKRTFTILPAFVDTSGVFYLLGDRSLIVSDNRGGAKEIEQAAKKYDSFRDLIRCMKLLNQEWTLKHIDGPIFSSSGFETAALEAARKLGREGWMRMTFPMRLGLVVSEISQCLRSGGALFAPNKDDTNLLEQFYSPGQEYRAHFAAWLEQFITIQPEQLLEKMENLLQQTRQYS